MLDPVTALGVAANVVQFVQLGIKIFKKSGALYKSTSGKATEDAQLESIAEDLMILTMYSARPLLARDPDACSPAESQLLQLTSDCKDVSKRMQELLKDLNIEEATELDLRHRVRRSWKAFHSTIQRMKKSGEIDSISKTLDGLSRRLGTCLLAIFK